MADQFPSVFPVVSTIFHSPLAPGHTARSQALTLFLQGLLVFTPARLSGMGRGIAVLYAEKSFRGQRKRAHRLLKNAKMATGETAAAFFTQMTQDLTPGCRAVAWTALGAFRGLEACLIVEGRGMP